MKLIDYIQGTRKGKEAHRLEKESMQDSFLADALDGYQQVEGSHEEQIKHLSTYISKRSAKNRNMYATVWSIASCLIIGIGISVYFLFMKNMAEDVNIATENSQLTIFTPPSLPKGITTPDSGKKRQDTVHSIAVQRSSKAPMSLVAMTEDTSDLAVEKKAEENNSVTDTFINPDNKLAKAVQLSTISDSMMANMTTAMAMEDSPKSNQVMMIRGTSNIVPQLAGRKSLLDKLPKDQIDRFTPKPVIGMRKYKKYLNKNLIRPTDDDCKDIKGKVTVTFYIDKHGTPQQIEVEKGLCESADKEAIRLIQEGPKWTHNFLPVTIEVQF